MNRARRQAVWNPFRKGRSIVRMFTDPSRPAKRALRAVLRGSGGGRKRAGRAAPRRESGAAEGEGDG